LCLKHLLNLLYQYYLKNQKYQMYQRFVINLLNLLYQYYLKNLRFLKYLLY
jgi:hypothetical protein